MKLWHAESIEPLPQADYDYLLQAKIPKNQLLHSTLAHAIQNS